ncbi:porin family protein [Planctobacterium marinum]|uniref:porin family protein n=1 Tax=Planctobacterium marinum TaxID=1631968 RepID=UPI001E310BC4|nr:porin family protein [Planctobacterium marinum]MCC2605981.1 porin family protein [Planctobacterium marinum]
MTLSNQAKKVFRCPSLLLTALCCGMSHQAGAAFNFEALLQLNLVHSEGTQSWLQRQTGQTRYDEDDSLELGQALAALSYDINSYTSLHSVVHYQTEQDAGFGTSQLYLKYKPIWSATYRPTFKVGVFYPEMSFENTDMGWLSPYTYSFSAINSWIAEEQRTGGIEAKLDIVNQGSAHKFSVTGALYKGNDTLGSMLGWRGWAIHNKQSVLNEIIFFDRYPSLGPEGELAAQAAWAEPSREIDGRIGFYVGGEWNYRGKSRLRYFYYDNNGDIHAPRADGGQFAWDTRYHSLAWQYRFNKSWRLIAQSMVGNSEMWNGKLNIDFAAYYLLLNYTQEQHRVSLRLDKFETKDIDHISSDDNDGHGNGITLSYKYKINDAWQVGAEYLYLDGFRASRLQFPDQQADVSQNQIMGALEYRF